MSTNIYLIRHGDVDNPDNVCYGREVDVPLTELGRRQLRAIGETIKQRGDSPSAIYTSPMMRAVDSSRTITEVFPETPIVVDKGLLEADTPGLAQYSIPWMETVANSDIYNYTGPEMAGITVEQPEEIAERVLEVVQRVSKEHDGQTVFLVSHGDPIAFAWARIRQAEGKLPSRITFGPEGTYPEKSEAVRLVVGEGGNIVEHKLIRSEE